MNSILLIIFLLFFVMSCNKVQTQEITNSSSKNVNSNNTESEEIGYPRFTKTDKQYLGCWRSIETSEVVEYELRFFRFNEKNIQISKVSKPVDYSEVDSNSYKDYFVLKTESKNNNVQPYLSINMVNNDEMTVHEFATKKDITDGEGIKYGVLKREDCKTISSKFK